MRQWKTVVVAAAVLGGAARSGTALGDVGPFCGFVPGAPASIMARPVPRTTPWLRFGGQKARGPQLQRSEAGLTLSLGRGVAVQLHYERTALSPMMHADHDDGVLTRLRLSF